MTTQPPAPPLRTGAHYLYRAAIYARFVATFLALVVAARFAVAAMNHALDVTTGAVATRPHPRPSHDPLPVPPPEPSLAPARRAALAEGTPEPAASGRPVSVMLGVDYGSPRSDVYVNGRKVGQTPFLGDTSCKTGQTLKIDIVQPKGLPLTYVRDCREGSLQIETPPP